MIRRVSTGIWLYIYIQSLHFIKIKEIKAIYFYLIEKSWISYILFFSSYLLLKSCILHLCNTKMVFVSYKIHMIFIYDIVCNLTKYHFFYLLLAAVSLKLYDINLLFLFYISYLYNIHIIIWKLFYILNFAIKYCRCIMHGAYIVHDR